MNTEEIRRLQQELNQQGYRDASGQALGVDGIIGPKTQYALDARQAAEAAAAAAAPKPQPGEPGYVSPFATEWAEKNAAGASGTSGQSLNAGQQLAQMLVGQQLASGEPLDVDRIAALMSIDTPRQSSGSPAVPQIPQRYDPYSDPRFAGLFQQLQSIQSQPLGDVRNTATYRAGQEQLQRDASDAATQMVQQMAARGVLRSSMTEDASRDIAESVVEALKSRVEPAALNELLARRQVQTSDIERQMSALMSALGLGMQEQANVFNQMMQQAQFGESQYRGDQAYGLQREGLALQQGGLDIQRQLAALQQTTAEHGMKMDEAKLALAEREFDEQIRQFYARLNADKTSNKDVSAKDLMDMEILRIYEKQKNGEPLTRAEREMYEAKMGLGATNINPRQIVDDIMRISQLTGPGGMPKYDSTEEILNALTMAYNFALGHPAYQVGPFVDDFLSDDRAEEVKKKYGQAKP